jgi:uncharacterized phage-associated protein
MTSIFDVAKYILHSVGGKMSITKLHILCYYCQAWHLAWHSVPLFPKDFRKWDRGPVCTETISNTPRLVFNQRKRYFAGMT